jgi:dihydroflavonol-4-reductase
MHTQISSDIERLTAGPVLITGATGFTGLHLTRRLAAAGVEVRALARPSADRTPLADLPISWHLGDLTDPTLIQQAMAGVRYVVHMATLYRSAAATEADHHHVHVTSTQRLAEAALQQPDFQRFIHVSTVGVHGHIKHPPADENAPFVPGDEYQRTKAAAEQWLTAYAQQNHLSYSIIRPCAIYGPGDRRLLKLFRMARRPWCPVIGHTPCLYHLIHVDDLVAIIIRAATHPAADGEAFIAGDPAPIRLDELLRLMAAAQGRTTRIIHIPYKPIWYAAIACEFLCKPFGIAPPLYRRRVKFFVNDRSFHTAKVRETLHFEFSYTLPRGIEQTASWYQAHNWL